MLLWIKSSCSGTSPCERGKVSAAWPTASNATSSPPHSHALTLAQPWAQKPFYVDMYQRIADVLGLDRTKLVNQRAGSECSQLESYLDYALYQFERQRNTYKPASFHQMPICSCSAVLRARKKERRKAARNWLWHKAAENQSDKPRSNKPTHSNKRVKVWTQSKSNCFCVKQSIFLQRFCLTFCHLGIQQQNN